MNLSRVIELTSAIASLTISIVAYIYSIAGDLAINQRRQVPSGVGTFVLLFALLVVPSALATIGAYAHAIRSMSGGLGFLAVAILIHTAIMVVFLVPLAWAYNGRGLPIFLIEFLLLLVALFAGCCYRALRKQSFEV